MSDRAWVESVEALKGFRAALCKFAEAVKVGLDEAEADVQRTHFWLKQDQYNHWKRQLQKRTERHAQAKSALSRKKMMKTPLGGRYSCVEEEKALAAAKRQLEEAREKLANVRRWQRLLDEESFTYQGVTQGMRAAIELDVPNALAQLDNMITALEAYAGVPTPGEQRSEAIEAEAERIGAAAGAASMARPTAPPEETTADAYRALRGRTPSQTIRDEMPITTAAVEWGLSEGFEAAARETLAGLEPASTPLAAEAKIVVARGIERYQRIYLERAARLGAGDSGWYIGPGEDVEVSGYDAVRIADLLGRLPALEAVLELPAGYLVVLKEAGVEAVLDSADRLLRPAGRPTA